MRLLVVPLGFEGSKRAGSQLARIARHTSHWRRLPSNLEELDNSRYYNKQVVSKLSKKSCGKPAVRLNYSPMMMRPIPFHSWIFWDWLPQIKRTRLSTGVALLLDNLRMVQFDNFLTTRWSRRLRIYLIPAMEELLLEWVILKILSLINNNLDSFLSVESILFLIPQ